MKRREHHWNSGKKEYSFPILNISIMLDDLLKTNLIKLLNIKYTKKIIQVDNINYCKYYDLINYPLDKDLKPNSYENHDNN
ncbi:hypothetical protein SADUNF_Sadunf07G0068100 [Salix dunnii]|uniref:Uncharacterized protein n=1 Tax=Salix dunnii TaxID=1413687 RepID=A0A835JWJ0_9ROSI|nr:hypothetical protein SADUNF_Sadunf07G0068100 [Salix dunnii]